jgi:hypothetical protein
MIVTVEREMRRSWHHLRRRVRTEVAAPKRLIVRKAVWLDDARSPVMLMIDDLTNAWHNGKGGDPWEAGGDWGGGHNRPGSALQSLEDGLLRPFPEARVTFFTVAGPISSYTHDRPFSYAAPLDADAASVSFFRQMAADPRFELAYHGHNHGTPGETTERFVQEFQGFESHDAAVAQPGNTRLLDEAEAKARLGALGVAVPAGKVTAGDDVESAADEIGYPVTLKALGQVHKSESGAVRVGLADRGAVMEALASMPESNEYLVEATVTDVIAEVLVAIRRDPPIGWLVTLGFGGVLTELWTDVAHLLAPVTGLAAGQVWPLVSERHSCCWAAYTRRGSCGSTPMIRS